MDMDRFIFAAIPGSIVFLLYRFISFSLSRDVLSYDCLSFV